MTTDMIWITSANIPCRCGSDKCVGYIVNQDQWDKLKKTLKREREKRKKEKKRKRPDY